MVEGEGFRLVSMTVIWEALDAGLEPTRVRSELFVDDRSSGLSVTCAACGIGGVGTLVRDVVAGGGGGLGPGG